MMLVLKPIGRGNWATVTMTVDAPADLFPTLRAQVVTVGMVIDFGGLRLRICEVLP